VSSIRAQQRGVPDRYVDWGLAVLGTALVFAAYVDAWARLQIPATTPYAPSRLAPWEELGVSVAWLLITGFLLLVLTRNLALGLAWRRALSDGHYLALLGCLILGAAEVADYYWSLALGFGVGLPALISPLHLLETVAGGLVVSGPLTAALHRRDQSASTPVIVSAALTLSVVTFGTQFAHPLLDIWSANTGVTPQVIWWIAQDMGAIAILFQTGILLAFMLLLVTQFTLPLWSLTLLCIINGALLVGLKAHYPLVAVMVLAGLVGDLLRWRLHPTPDRREALYAFSATVPAVYTASYAITVAIVYGTWWPFQLWLGLGLLASLGGLMLTYFITHVSREGAHAAKTGPDISGEPPLQWPRHRVEVTPRDVKTALDMLDSPARLADSPMTLLACISGQGFEAGQQLRTLLLDVVGELAASNLPRDAEAGQLLMDYYVRHVGSHDTIAERLHLSRPTFYRRLQRGLNLVAERLDELGEFAGDGSH
jgi:hypothetical protein